MFDIYEPRIRAEAMDCYPEEGVWLITEAGCRQVQNAHEDPCNFFRVGLKDLCQAETEGLKAVVHSHPDRLNVPSASDMQGQVNTAVPWGVLTSGKDGAGKIRWWGPDNDSDLIGRTFVHGVTDCYALVRDYYRMELGIRLPEVPRDWEWWNKGQDLILDSFESVGFRRIPAADAQPGDVWAAKVRGTVAHHCGVLLDRGLIIHQPGGPGRAIDKTRLSSREPVGRYANFITTWLRYEK